MDFCGHPLVGFLLLLFDVNGEEFCLGEFGEQLEVSQRWGRSLRLGKQGWRPPLGAACLERGQKDGVKAPRQPRSEARGGACKRGGEDVKQGWVLQGAERRAALQ